MSWRAIQDTVAASESLASLSHGAERLYWRILAATDAHGRLPGSHAKVRAQCLPLVKAKDAEIEKWLVELDAIGRIVRYHADGRDLIQVADFDSNQPAELLRRRGDSRFPAPSKTTRFAGNSGSAPDDSGSAPEESRLEEKRREENYVPNGTSPTKSAGDDVKKVYDHWRRARSKTNARYDQISPARRQRIQTRLREFPADELIRAIDAVALDPWEERSRHDDLTVILRSREQVEKFLGFAEDQASMSPSERLRARMAERGIE